MYYPWSINRIVDQVCYIDMESYHDISIIVVRYELLMLDTPFFSFFKEEPFIFEFTEILGYNIAHVRRLFGKFV